MSAYKVVARRFARGESANKNSSSANHWSRLVLSAVKEASTPDATSHVFHRWVVGPSPEGSDVEVFHGYLPDEARVARIARHFSEAQRCVNSFSRLPEGSEFHIEADAARVAHHVIGLMTIQGVEAPNNVFAHSGDAVVFGWSENNNAVYLTLNPEGASVLKPDGESGERISVDYEFAEMGGIDRLLGSLSGISWKRASST